MCIRDRPAGAAARAGRAHGRPGPRCRDRVRLPARVRIGDLPRIDASIEAALLLSALAARAGDRVDLIAFDRRIRSQVAGANGPRLLPALADALAPVEPALVEADWPGIVGAVQRRLSRRCLLYTSPSPRDGLLSRMPSSA